MKITPSVLVLVALAGCKEHEFHPPDRAAKIAQADTAYAGARFDTIQWASAAERLRAGNLVYVDHCRRCHGPAGQGKTEYAQEHNLEVPSLVAPDWRFRDQPDSVRHRVFVGHVRGMPTWGIAGITPRDIDAVTAYLLGQLASPRPPRR